MWSEGPVPGGGMQIVRFIALDAFIHKGSLSGRGWVSPDCEMVPLKTVDIFRLLPMAKKNCVQME
jgi:hypothetical protein